jgi:hypothetical protein
MEHPGQILEIASDLTGYSCASFESLDPTIPLYCIERTDKAIALASEFALETSLAEFAQLSLYLT